MADKAFIYVLTNQSFSGHDWVKIGYASDVERRRKELSHTAALPYPFEIYATYEIPAKSRIADKVLHKLITQLNPSLRLVKNREFFEMTPEAAYDLLKALATIHNCEEKLVKYEKGKPVVASPSANASALPAGASAGSGASSLPLLKDCHELFHIDTTGGRATLTVDTGSFVVKAGSVVRICDGKKHPMKKAHDEDLTNGLLERSGDFATLKADKSFNSPSMAGAYVKAINTNGWEAWKGPDGKRMDAVVQRR